MAVSDAPKEQRAIWSDSIRSHKLCFGYYRAAPPPIEIPCVLSLLTLKYIFVQPFAKVGIVDYDGDAAVHPDCGQLPLCVDKKCHHSKSMWIEGRDRILTYWNFCGGDDLTTWTSPFCSIMDGKHDAINWTYSFRMKYGPQEPDMQLLWRLVNITDCDDWETHPLWDVRIAFWEEDNLVSMGPISHIPHRIGEDQGSQTIHVDTNDVVDITSSIGSDWYQAEWDGGCAQISVHVDMHWNQGFGHSAARKVAVIALSTTINGNIKKLLSVRRTEHMPQRLQFATMNACEIFDFKFHSQ